MSKNNLFLNKIFEDAQKLYQKKKYEKAKVLFEKVLISIPKHFPSIFLLGTLSSQIKDYQSAKKLLLKAIKINPDYAEAHNNLGNVYQELNNNLKAIICFQKAINIKPNFLIAYYNLANSFKVSIKYDDAIYNYQKVLNINPNHIDSINNLGNTYLKIKEYDKAIFCYQKIIKIEPNLSDSYNNLGSVLFKIKKYKDAIYYYQKAITIKPNYAIAYFNLANVFYNLGKTRDANECLQKALKIEPTNLSFCWLSLNNLPIIYNDFEEINFYNKNFQKKINSINNLIDQNITYSKKLIINALQSSTNFYLHYQGLNISMLQFQYAKIIENLTKKIYPELQEKKIKQNKTKKIKVGFISSFLRNHTIFKLFKNWIIKLDINNFEKFAYYTENKFDENTKFIIKNVDDFFSDENIDNLIKKISKDNLDVIIYLDIGMNPINQILSSLKLAPIQCNTFGHPITSGFKHIDYFFTTQLAETEVSQSHYSEKLIFLPNIGIDYDKIDLSNIKQPILSKKTDKVIYLNLQSLFKLLPQDDDIYYKIIDKNPNSIFWFIGGSNESITSKFKERMLKKSNNYEKLIEKNFVFHPQYKFNKFLGLIEQSDIILDSISWSGGNTSLEALSLNKPIVTLPSNFMRGRYTYNMLKIIGSDETIAYSKKQYIEIALKLANDMDFRNFIISKIIKNKNKLFNDNKPIKFIENFLKDKINI